MLRRLKAGPLLGTWAAVLTLTALAFGPAAAAEVINVEFNFTPYVGDPAKEDQVVTVPGTARVFINNVPYAEQEVREQEVPVLFDEREIAPSVWVPAASCGKALRKGKNTLRLEFEPESGSKPYHAQLRWASVMDESTEESEPGHYTGTNQSGEGVEDKAAKGKVVFEREFTADFAEDLPWHHYPPVTALTDKDKTELAALVEQRVNLFKPDFAGLYHLIEQHPEMDATKVKEAKCLDTAYAVGARIVAPPLAEIEFVTTGNPEVVIRAQKGDLFTPADPQVFEKIEGDELQMCVGMTLSVAYPPRLVVVRAPSGDWEIAY